MTMTRAPPGAAKAASPRRPSPQKPCGDGWTGGSPCNRYRTRRRGTTITSCGQTFAIRPYPAQRKKANEQALARKGGKGWISSDSKCHADNMRGDTNALKLSGAGTERVYWAPILSTGKLHVEMLPHGFPGETEQGAVILMQKVRNALNVRFQVVAKPPNVIFVDRGNGFYVQTTGDVTPAYKAALRDNGLRNYMGDNCGMQPGQLGDVLLHETAVAWVRRRERQTVPTRA